jgi:hypothetical protein
VAELTIAVRRLPGSDGLGVRVSLESDDDALPHEHEAEHRRLVARLFPAWSWRMSRRPGCGSAASGRPATRSSADCPSSTACPVRAGADPKPQTSFDPDANPKVAKVATASPHPPGGAWTG